MTTSMICLFLFYWTLMVGAFFVMLFITIRGIIRMIQRGKQKLVRPHLRIVK